MKKILVSLLLVIGVFYFVGELSDSWFIHQLGDIDIVDPVINLVLFCFIAAMLIMLGFFIAVSLLGAVVLGLIAAIFGVVFIGLHLFWPILFIILIVYLVVDGKQQSAC